MSQDSSINDSSLMLDDSISFSNRFDFEETIRQIQEQSKKVSNHLSQYSKYLAPSPKAEKSEPQTTPSNINQSNQSSPTTHNYYSSVPSTRAPSSTNSTSVETKQNKPVSSLSGSNSNHTLTKNVQSATPLTSKYSASDPIEALMRDFRNEVKDIDNCIQTSSNDSPSNYKYDSLYQDEEEAEGYEEEPEYSMYNTSTPINESVKKSNRLLTESMSKFKRTNDSEITPPMLSHQQTNQAHNRLGTNMMHNDSAFSPILNSSSKISHTSSPVITFSTAEKSRVSSVADPDIMFTPKQLGSGLFSNSTVTIQEKPKQHTQQSTNTEMLLRIENIQLKDEISKLNATVVSMQSRMEGMEKSMKQLFELLTSQNK